MKLNGKTILFLGSSVTYGSAAGGVSFADLMADHCGINCIKEAVNGTTLTDVNETSYVSRLKKVDKTQKVDLFICQLSTNDASGKIEISRIEEAIRFIISYAKSTFNCPIAFYTGTYYESDEYAEMVKLLLRLKEELDFYILDLYNDEEMRNISEDDYKKYMNDPIHPNIKGYTEWWLPKFIEFCEELPL